MERQANKALVERYFNAISDGRTADAWAMLADDAIWTVGGHSPLTGTYTKQQLAELTERTILARLATPLRITLHRVIAEDDSVAAEFSGEASRADGRVYANDYLFLFTIRDGKLWRCTEYLDTLHYADVILN
ncbi:nuclear transport factor 2 family protein [Flavisphingomonas formosensis]|uniref:nuclear transport factor 2 family protein n=1 Tax=Flavisphingomonas formosensis TaxID=861534 RepID=UPI0012FA63D7|nr:nuclear transport factor 2 family protein [Sphingomonas formosensis]